MGLDPRDFLKLALKSDAERAHLAWNAIDAVFVAAFSTEKPRPSRDQDATPYTLPFNVTLQALNLQLRHRIMELHNRPLNFPPSDQK